MPRFNSLHQSLLGTLAGDMIGLPFEGLHAKKVKRLIGADGADLKPSLLWGRSSYSDDTEHSILVVKTLIESELMALKAYQKLPTALACDTHRSRSIPGVLEACSNQHPDSVVDPASDPVHQAQLHFFEKRLHQRIKWWFVSLSPGIGMATLKSCLKMWCGVGPKHSGVSSAGNGSAMRSAIMGVYFQDEPLKIYDFVRASTYLTHKDPQAFEASLLVACAAAVAAENPELTVEDAPALFGHLEHKIKQALARHQPDDQASSYRQGKSFKKAPDDEVDPYSKSSAAQLFRRSAPTLFWMLSLLHKAIQHQWSVKEVAIAAGCEGFVSGYVRHTVPVALMCWLKHPQNVKAAITEAILSGGDTDSVAAIAGGVVGANVRATQPPKAWLDQHLERKAPALIIKELSESLHQALKLRQATPSTSLEPLRDSPFHSESFSQMVLSSLLRLPRNLLSLPILIGIAARREILSRIK